MIELSGVPIKSLPVGLVTIAFLLYRPICMAVSRGLGIVNAGWLAKQQAPLQGMAEKTC